MKNETKEAEGVTIPTSKAGRILEDKLMQVIYGSTGKRPTKDGSTTDALSNTLSQLQGDPGEKINAIISYKEKIMADSQELWYLILLMAMTGCRVSEALSIRVHEISNDGRVRLKGLKGSNDRIVHESEVSKYLIYCKSIGKNPFQTFDRFFVYRYLKSLGIGQHFNDNQRKSVTHIFRHLAIEDMQTIDPDLQATKRAIGHKSVKNTEHYAKPEKRRG